MRRGAHAAFALQRLDQDARGLRTDRLLDGIEVAKRHLVETIHRRPKTFEIFRRAGRGQCRQRAAVKRAVEGDDAVTLGMALGGVIFARDLDRAFHRFGAGIGEEDEVGKALFAQPGREFLAVRALEQVRHVPEPRGLILQRRHQRRVAVAERVHRDAGGEIEIALAVGCDQPAALAALETEIGPGEYGKQMRRRAVGHGGHGGHCWVRTRPRCAHWRDRIGNQPRKTKRAAFSGQHVELFYAQEDGCQPVGGRETRKGPVSRKERTLQCLADGTCGRTRADSCAGVTPYCSFFPVGYDISCGSTILLVAICSA